MRTSRLSPGRSVSVFTLEEKLPGRGGDNVT